MLPDVVKRIGANRLMIGSNYPNRDATLPNTVRMPETRRGLAVPDMGAALGGAAAEFLSLKQHL